MPNYSKIVFVFLLLVLPVSIYPQSKTDSLKNLLNKATADSTKILLLNKIGEEYLNIDTDKAIKFINESKELSKKVGYGKGLLINLMSAGKIYKQKGDFVLAKKYYEKALSLYKKKEDYKGMGESEKNLGIVYENLGKFDKALDHYLSALDNMEKINDEGGIASCMNSIGLIYYHENNYEEALKYFIRTLEKVKKLNYTYAIAITQNNIGLIYENTERVDSALIFYKRAAESHKSLNNLYDLAIVYNNIANSFNRQKQYDKAIDYLKRSIDIDKEIDDQFGLAATYLNIGKNYEDVQKYDLAEGYYKKALAISKDIGDIQGQRDAYDNLAGLYGKRQMYKQAFKAYQQHLIYKDSVFTKERQEFISQLQEEFNAEKREQQIKLLNKDKALQDTQIKQQRILIIIFVAVSIIILGFLIMLIRLFNHKKKANVLLEKQNKEILEQKEVIEEKNREIMDSIKYAQRIQEAILPPDKLIKETVTNSFVLYKPKDIVSGDFYWMDAKEDTIFFSAVDCTGHGVPGAFMSIVGHNGLNRALNEFKIIEPGKMLDKLNFLVEETLHQEGKYDVKDGMDLALCSYNHKLNLLEYAGANNPLYLVRKGEEKVIVNGEEIEANINDEDKYLYEVKATKQPIGSYEDRKPFINNKINIKKGDIIYVFSDGYPDQFGGPKNKKFKYKPLKRLLLKIYEEELKQQREILVKTMDDWKGDVEQIDDICMIGVKI